MTWWMWSGVANILIMGLEYSYRTKLFDSFLQGLPYMIVPLLIMQFALSMSFKGAPTYMLAWAVLTVGNAVLRVGSNHFFVQEHFNWMIALGVAGMIGCGFLIKYGSNV